MRVLLVIAAVCGTLGIGAVLAQIAVAQWTRAKAGVAWLERKAQIAESLSKRLPNQRPPAENAPLGGLAAMSLGVSGTLHNEYANDEARAIDELQQEVRRLSAAVEALVAKDAEPHDSLADRVADIKGFGGVLLAVGALLSLAALWLSTAVALATLPTP